MIGPDRKQELLEGDEPEARLLLLLETLIQENEFIALENEISERVHDSFERQQRRVFLHERLKVLQEELGEEGEEDSERGAYLKQLREKKLPEAAAAALTKEIKRLSDLPPLSAEVAVAKTYLDTALGLPWGTRSASSIPDVVAVARVLDETHYGLKSVKDRIIEYLAVASLRGGTPPNAILCLVGPPGVGKTSVAMATAKGLDRPLQRISLGGVRDEGEIRGHRRTYVGAMPGRIIDALKRAGVDDPVVVLDEIDKMEADWRGDPGGGPDGGPRPGPEPDLPGQLPGARVRPLTCVLHRHRQLRRGHPRDAARPAGDHPASRATPTGRSWRSRPRHLVPKIAEESGLSDLGNVFTPAALRASHPRVHARGRGAGDGPAHRQGLPASGPHEGGGQASASTRGTARLARLVGPAPFLAARLGTEPQVGVSLGLAYTGAGGDVLRIECVVTPGKGDFHLTGQLGEIMQESVTAAWGYLKTSLVRDPTLGALWADSPGRAYLLDNYQQPESGDDAASGQRGDRRSGRRSRGPGGRRDRDGSARARLPARRAGRRVRATAAFGS